MNILCYTVLEIISDEVKNFDGNFTVKNKTFPTLLNIVRTTVKLFRDISFLR